MPAVAVPLPDHDFEPTEVAVPWHALRGAGYQVVFATESGSPGKCDPLALRGVLFGTIGATKQARELYAELEQDPAFAKPVRWHELRGEDFVALHLAGGHGKGMRPYLESPLVQALAVDFMTAAKPVGAICHGPIVLARAMDPHTGTSVVAGRRMTALTRAMEKSAWWMTRLTLGDHFRTYPTWVQDEVEAALGEHGTFETGGFPPSSKRPLVVTDASLVTARWPGDARAYAEALVHGIDLRSRVRARAPTRELDFGKPT